MAVLPFFILGRGLWFVFVPEIVDLLLKHSILRLQNVKIEEGFPVSLVQPVPFLSSGTCDTTKGFSEFPQIRVDKTRAVRSPVVLMPVPGAGPLLSSHCH